LADSLSETLIKEKLDYISPDRLTCASAFYSEAVTLEALKKAASLTRVQEDLEHVTRYIINNRERFLTRFIDADLSPDFMNNVKLTIDYPEDIKRADIILNQLPNKTFFTSQDILSIVKNKKGAICLE
jgi:spore coat polysaccharide biosynthesis protein SpsF (cytidylyltransferase family)